jgi:hypothetical protein
MDTLARLSQLRSQRDGLLKRLAAIGDFRPGSMGPRFRKCGKPGCHCARDGEKGHGPIWSLTRKVDGKTVTKAIPVSAVDQTQQQLAEYHRSTRPWTNWSKRASASATPFWKRGRNQERQTAPRQVVKKGAPRGVQKDDRRGTAETHRRNRRPGTY